MTAEGLRSCRRFECKPFVRTNACQSHYGGRSTLSTQLIEKKIVFQVQRENPGSDSFFVLGLDCRYNILFQKARVGVWLLESRRASFIGTT